MEICFVASRCSLHLEQYLEGGREGGGRRGGGGEVGRGGGGGESTIQLLKVQLLRITNYYNDVDLFKSTVYSSDWLLLSACALLFTTHQLGRVSNHTPSSH